MECREFLEEIEQWTLDSLERETGRLPIPEELLEHAGHCSSCAARLEAARQLTGQAETLGVPEDLGSAVADRVMARIDLAQRDEFSAEKTKKSMGIHSSRFALAAASIVFAATLALTMMSGPSDTVGEDYTAVRLQIEAPDASEVVVVGDWNNWNPEAHSLKRDGRSGTWEIVMKLEKDQEYRYQFVIDGSEWIPDPDAPAFVDDGFGGVNSLLVI